MALGKLVGPATIIAISVLRRKYRAGMTNHPLCSVLLDSLTFYINRRSSALQRSVT